MSATIIDGKAIAEEIRQTMTTEIASLNAAGNRKPRIDVVRVGDDPASEVYVRMKEKAAGALGMDGRQHHLDGDSSAEVVREKIQSLNADPAVDGILLQLPLPDHLSESELIRLIDPDKDVDGFHPENLGCLIRGEDTVLPCTPAGVMELIKRTGTDLKGKRVLVVGRSNIVGKPVAQLLLQQHATVTIAHSRTVDLAAEVGRAEVVVAAVGVAELVKGEWIAPGAVVIDVGVNRMPDGKLKGDVEFLPAADRASWITPVPGGVGPMTITWLLKNTLQLYKKHLGI